MRFQRPLATAILSLTICVSVVAQNTIFQAKVIRVVDGTTVVVETQSKSQFHVRCLGAVAPEQEMSGVESNQRLSAVLLGETVTIEYRKRNKNGNLLGSIRLKDQDICLDQIRTGLARLDAETAAILNSSERTVYADAESVARNNAIGLWSNRTNLSNTVRSNLLTTENSDTSTVDVSGYLRKDGTYVPPNKRTSQDKVADNNWSTTGTPGRKSWLRRNWWIFPTVGALIGAGYLAHRYSGTGGGIPCVDGTISQAQNRQGACSHHGGIR